MRDEPCFRCTLPDCDEKALGCLLRQLAVRYQHKLAKVRKGHLDQAPTDEERAAYNLHFYVRDKEKAAEASEGLRQYSRWEKRRKRDQVSP